MPLLQQVDDLLNLLGTKTPIVMIETHEEQRVLALFERIAARTQREVWAWSASRGLKVSHGLKLSLTDFGSQPVMDSTDTRQLPDALQQVDRLPTAALVLLLDVHPYLSNPLITRALKEIALRSEGRGLQILLVGHDIALPANCCLSPAASSWRRQPSTWSRSCSRKRWTATKANKGRTSAAAARRWSRCCGTWSGCRRPRCVTWCG